MIQVVNLNKTFRVGRMSGRKLQAVRDVSFSVGKGETLGLVGESGCGKSTVARLVLKLLRSDSGTIWFDGHDITSYSMKRMMPLRRQMQMMFQHPDSALNPRRTMLDSLLEPLLLHRMLNREDAAARAVELLELVGLQPDLLRRYPHQLSGGQIQRIALARALMLEPKLLVLDEATSMLDVSVQAQVIELLRAVQKRYELAYLFISHDLELVRYMCDRIAVMQHGRIVELERSDRLIEQPEHPYTKQLVHAFRSLG